MDLDVPAEIYDRYSCGWCMHLAAALHRELGWTIQAVVTTDMTPNYIEHAWVIDPSETHMLDIDGYNPITMNGWPSPANRLHENLSEDQLKDLTKAGYSDRNKFDDAKWNNEVSLALNDILKSNIIRNIMSKYKRPPNNDSRGPKDKTLENQTLTI